MRDILDSLEQLTEATGFAGRKPGDTFRNGLGDEAQFVDIAFFPPEGKYEPAQLDAAEKKASQKGVHWQNAKSPRSGGFAIVTLQSPEDTTPFYIGRYLEQIKPNKQSNYIPNSFSINGEPWKFVGNAKKAASGEASKSESKLSPQDLLGDMIDLTIPDIMGQLAMSLGTENPLYAVAHAVATGSPLPIKFPAPEGYSFSAFRDYFCEILQPMAIQKGQYTGNAGEAAQKFLDGTFQGTLISFDETKTAGLSDSIMSTKDGRSVLISTKGGAGAKASAKNLFDKIEQLEQTKDGQKFLKKHAEVVDILQNIVKYGQGGSPLYLGIKYDIISEKEAEQIKNLRNQQLVNLKNIEATPLTPRLKKFATERNTKTPESTDLYYHLMASVAEKAARAVNEHTNFSKAATEILNNGALVQVYTKAKESKTEWTLDEFETVYPSDIIKGVYLDAGKTYYSTGIKGNYTFKIDKGEGVPKDDEGEETRTTKPVNTKGLAKAAKDIVEPKRKERKERPQTDRGEPDVGRAKRPKR